MKCGLVNLTSQSLSLGFPGQSMAEGGKGEKLNRAEISNQGKADYKVEQIRGGGDGRTKQTSSQSTVDAIDS